ncbi:MAG TPA: hypothetical protein DCL54_00175 [Alphaproteobacteria bacterium]|nr:hypothetical protein [Alphaproteobacteria bacterium]
MLFNRLMCGSSALVLALGLAVPAYSQAVSSSVRGEVISTETGDPVSGASVVITDTRTNARVTTTVGADGFFNASGLDVGGPYTIDVTAAGFKSFKGENIALTLGEPFRVLVPLEKEQIAVTEKVTVVGVRNPKIDARGVGQSFNQSNVRDLPAINRDFKDIISQNPLAYQDAGTVIGGIAQNPISIAGQNPRCNSFLVDGLPVNDSFGLNNNGYPTARGPLPIDWSKQVQVAVSPYNTEYNDFCGGVVNVVTKSGANDWHGSAYYYFKDVDLIGRSIGAANRAKPEFYEENFGATISGAIIPDTLFFFGGYDRTLRVTPVSIGAGEGVPAGTFSTQVPGITQAEVDQVINISNTVYGFNPGSGANSFQEDNRRWIAKINWNINEDHRLQYTYSKAEGGTLSTRASSSSTLPILGLSSNWYLDAEVIQNQSLQVFSNWSDNFSTEFRIGRVNVTGDQAPLSGAEFPEVYVRTNGVDNVAGNGDDGYIVIGADQFRHFNILEYKFDIMKLTGTYSIDSHVIFGGYELKELSIFNGFVQGSDGIFRFDSIANFQSGTVASTNDTRLGSGRGREPIRYANAPNNNENTASAAWGYDIDSFYIQDDWDVTSDLSIMVGLRYDVFSTTGTITPNAGFTAAYGFDNTKTLDGLDAIMPRASFSYDIPGETADDLSVTFRGGLGRYTGGSPNVWLSNSYSNTGINYVQVQGTPGQAVTGGNLPAANFIGQPPVNFNLFPVPAALQTLLTFQSGNGPVNALDPNFELPSTWRYSVGVDGKWDGFNVTGEVLYMDLQDQLMWRDLRSIDTGARTLADNRIIYGPIGTRPNDGGRDVLLYNVDEGSAFFLIGQVEKNFDFDEGAGEVKLRLGYTYSEVEDIGGGTASTADSNFQQRAFVNLNEPLLGRSDYERRHRVTMGANLAYDLFGGFQTRFNLFGQHMSGQPFSYVYSNNPYGGNGNSFRNLVYVPKTDGSGNVTLTSDANVNYAGGFDIVAWDAFLKSSGLIQYAGGIAPRNEFFSDWSTRFDVSLEQDVKLWNEHKIVLELDVQNVGNLINKSWGQFTSPSFPPMQGIVSSSVGGGACAAPVGEYCYSGFSTTTVPGQIVNTGYPSSVWQVQVGARYEF